MKILISAKACNPHWGSESYVGWAAVQCLARDHELWVLTGSRNRPDLEKARGEGKVPGNIHFIFVGKFKEWHPNRFRAHLQSWREYVDFSKDILPIARELHDKVRFDIAHHLTLSSWRVPSPLWKLGIPTVFGPVGGAEYLPFKFLPRLSGTAAVFELGRKVSNLGASFSPAVRTCMRRAAHVFVTNAETEDLVVRMRGSAAGVSRLLSYFHQGTEENRTVEKDWAGPLRLVAGGSLDGRKGVALAVLALAKAKSQGVQFRYRFDGNGPEFNHIQQLAHKLGIGSEVVLGQSPREGYKAELHGAHIYLLPSLRDSAGISLAEAMLAACVPLVANSGGPGQIVTDECGYKVPVTSPRGLIDEIARIIVEVDRNRSVLQQKGVAAAKRIATEFSEENYRTKVNSVYQSIRR